MASGKTVLQKLGGSYQLVIEKPEDLERISELDPARWMATSVPLEGLTCDQAFLNYIDYDRNGRVRADELKAALGWTLRVLADRSRMAEGSASLRLAAIDVSHAEGAAIRASAEQILKNLGVDTGDDAEITLEHVRDRKKILGSGAANGDGIIPPKAVDDEELAGFISDIMETQGPVADASGTEGVGAEGLKKFIAEAEAYLEWSAAAELPDGAESTDVLVWGAETAPAATAIAAVRDKLDEFFSLCALTRVDARVADRAPLGDAELAALDLTDRRAIDDRTAALPISPPTPDEALHLDSRINPAWRPALADFEEKVLARALGPGRSTLERADWERVKSEFSGYFEWQAGKKGASVEKLGGGKLRAYADGGLAAKLQEMIEQDREVADELRQMENVEKLVLCQRWLMEFCNNFVSFPFLYDPSKRSLVEYGTLIMDGRRFGLCVRVTDRAEHKLVAQHSHIYLIYLEITGKKGDEDEKFEVAAAVTRGSTALLCVGKRGIFYTTDGREFDARIVEVIDNPVGLKEAVKRPFKRLGAFVGKQIERLTASGYEQFESSVGKGLTEAGTAAQGAATSPGAAKPAGGGAGMGLLLVGGGIGVGMIGSAVAKLIAVLASLSLGAVLKAFAVVFLVIATPTLIVAYVKLRRRNISMLLEACGWAVNAQMRLTRRLGRLFTSSPALPPGARKRRADLAGKLGSAVDEDRPGVLAWLVGVALSAAAGALIGYLLFWQLGLSEALFRYLSS